MHRTRTHSQGFTIVSILVAMAISLFLLAGVLSVYLNSRDAFAYQAALAATSENGRFAIDDLRRSLFMTGRGLLASQSAFGAYPSAIYDGSAGGADGLAVVYAAGLGCTGTAVTTASQQAFSVTIDGEGNSTLSCTVGGGTAQPLVSGVEWMQVLYGVDDDADDYSNRYLNATEVNTAGVWNNVVALRVGLVVSSGEFTVPASARGLTPGQMTVLDQTFTPTDTSLLYKTITTTIPLRNLTIVER